MSARDVIVAVLLGVGVLFALVSALGMAVMKDPYQRLHYIAPVATITPALMVVALFVGERDRQAGFKALLVALVLLAINGVVTHATARAARVREHGRWTLDDDARPQEGGSE